MSLPIPSINGLYYDHTSLRLDIPGVASPQMLTSHLKSLNYSDQLTPSTGYGTSPIRLPSGLGQYSSEGSMTISKEAWDKALASLPNGYGAVLFGLSLVYVSRGSFLPSKVDLVQVRFESIKDASSQGTANLDVEIKLNIRYILRNGKCLAPLDIDEVSVAI
jgi:hypothetical protein